MAHQPLPHNHGTDATTLIEHMPEAEDFQLLAESFRLLGDGSRLRIFWILCHQELCVINLSALMDMSSPAVSHHLKQLRAGALITSRREGKEVYYQAADTKQARLLHDAIEALMAIRCPTE